MTATSTFSLPINLDSSWLKVIGDEFEQPYMRRLASFLEKEIKAGKIIFPARALWFHAFNSTPFDQVKVVLLGQDPYHGPGQAHGLCFSVMPGVPLPQSLRNIFKELHNDLGIALPAQGCLQKWADQGVLLLNTTLTVEQGKAGAHQGKGWEQFTDRVIQHLNEQKDDLIFLLWGRAAQSKERLIESRKHLILKAPHPSPLSAHRGFFGCAHFSKVNKYLVQRGRPAIHWSLN